MGLFISLKIDRSKCKDGCRQCADVCPVDIFALVDGALVSIEENEDECTLCNLCLERCPSGAIQLIKHY